MSQRCHNEAAVDGLNRNDSIRAFDFQHTKDGAQGADWEGPIASVTGFKVFLRHKVSIRMSIGAMIHLPWVIDNLFLHSTRATNILCNALGPAIVKEYGVYYTHMQHGEVLTGHDAKEEKECVSIN